METIIILISVIAYALIESRHDYHVIKGNSDKWHSWGMAQNAIVFIPLLFLFDWRLVIASGILFWQLHDSFIGWQLYRRLFYLGSKGMDRWINRVFQNGKTFAVIRFVFIAILIYDYLRY